MSQLYPSTPDAAPVVVGRRLRRPVSLVTAAVLTLLGLLTGVVPTASAAVLPGSVVAWGEPGYTPVPASLNVTGATAVAAGMSHLLALTPAGRVVAWGDDSYGQTDVPSSLDGTRVTAIAAGNFHSMALTSDGQVVVWGNCGGCADLTVPASVENSTVTAIAAGGQFDLALTDEGQVLAWGNADYGQLDLPPSLDGQTITAISAGGFHSLALTAEGKVLGWGFNSDGQSDVPASLDDQTVVAISAGFLHSLALTSDGKIVAWGHADNGETAVPQSLDGRTVSAVSAGFLRSLALTSDGDVVAWGDDGLYGQGEALATRDGKRFTALDGGLYVAAALTQGVSPVVSASPQPVRSEAGTEVSFSASASGAPTPTVRWQRSDDGETFDDIEGAASATYTLTPGTDDNGARFRAVFTNEAGMVTTDAATLSVNRAPTTKDVEVTPGYESDAPVTLLGSDPDGDTLTYTVVDEPEHGELSGDAPNLTYTPDDTYSGSDSFSYTATDGTLTSAPATVSITVGKKPNTAPTAKDLEITTGFEKAVAVTLTGTDPDDDALSFDVLTDPEHGQLSGDAPDLTYTPDDDYEGLDSFTYVANDGTTDSAAATVSLTVEEKPNTPPKAKDLDVTAGFATPASVTLAGTDADDDPLTYAVVDQPAHGELSGDAPELTYTPADGFDGKDSFTYRVNDGTDDSSLATVSITVDKKPNTPPVAQPIDVTAPYQTATPVTLKGLDPDGDTLSFLVVDQPAHGTLSGTAPELTYTPEQGYDGSDSFTYTAADGTDTSAKATVSITVEEKPNTAPAAKDLTVTAGFGSATPVTLSASDPDDDTLTYAVSTQPAHGTLTGTAPALTYTPAGGYDGPDSFTYTVSDGTLVSGAATVSITVTEKPNAAPVAKGLDLTVGFEAATPVALSGSDPDGDAVTYAVLTQPAHGRLSGTAPGLTYTPVDGFTGDDAFTYRVNDGTVDSAVARVDLTVTAQSCVPSMPKREFSVDVDQKDGDGKVHSPKFSTKKSGELLLAYVAVNGSTSGPQSVTKVSGGGLTWTLVQRENTTRGTSEIWQAYAAQKLGSTRVDVGLAQKGYSVTLTVAGFSGARPTVGASAHQTGVKSAPQVSLTPQASGSVVWGVGRVVGSRYDPKTVSGQKVVHDETFKSPSTGYWVQRTTAASKGGTEVVVGAKAKADSWGLAAVEIRGVCS